jgi:hypothetical protein
LFVNSKVPKAMELNAAGERPDEARHAVHVGHSRYELGYGEALSLFCCHSSPPAA